MFALHVAKSTINIRKPHVVQLARNKICRVFLSSSPPSTKLKTNNLFSSSSIRYDDNDNNNNNDNNESTIHVHNGIISDENNNIDRMSYIRGWAWQQILLNERLKYEREKKEHANNTDNKEDIIPSIIKEDSLLLLEFNPVYTLGKGAKNEHVLFLKDNDEMKLKLGNDKDASTARLNMDRKLYSQLNIDLSNNNDSNDILESLLAKGVSNIIDKFDSVLAPNGVLTYRVERGGEITYHGPGQLVVYPLLNLRSNVYKQDLHWYLHKLEQVIIQTLQSFNIDGVRDDINTGVWVNKNKIAAIGISSSRWITTHGFAINVNPNLDYFDTSIMVPCGIHGRGVTSIAKEVSGTNNNHAVVPSLNEVAKVVVQSFQDVFNVCAVRGMNIH